jgi:hypothetical protein
MRSATLSPCGRYRHDLARWWGTGRRKVLWVMCNPSTADGEKDDPTVRRVDGYTRSWGYDGFVIVNLYDWRAADPKQLRSRTLEAGVVSDRNDSFIRSWARKCELIVAAWGRVIENAPDWENRSSKVLSILDTCGTVHALKITKSGHPAHPLMLHSELKPFHWTGAFSYGNKTRSVGRS